MSDDFDKFFNKMLAVWLIVMVVGLGFLGFICWVIYKIASKYL